MAAPKRRRFISLYVLCISTCMVCAMPPVHGDGPPGGPPEGPLGGNSGGVIGGSSSGTATAATPAPAPTTTTSPSTASPSPSSSTHNSTATTTSTTTTPTTATLSPSASITSSSTSSQQATARSSGSAASSTTIASSSQSSSSASASSSTNGSTTQRSKSFSKSWEVPVIIGGAVALVAVAVIFVYMRSAKRHRDEKRVSTPPPLRAVGSGGGGYRQQTTTRSTYDGLLLSPSSRSHPSVPATTLLQERRPRKVSKQLKQPTIANRPITPSSEIETVTEPSLIHQAKYTISGDHYQGDSVVDISHENRVTGISEWSADSQEYQHNPPQSFYANLDPRESEYSPVYSTFSRDTGSEYGMSQRFDSEIILASEPSLEVSNRQTGAEFHDSQHDTRRIDRKPAQRLQIREFNF